MAEYQKSELLIELVALANRHSNKLNINIKENKQGNRKTYTHKHPHALIRT